MVKSNFSTTLKKIAYINDIPDFIPEMYLQEKQSNHTKTICFIEKKEPFSKKKSTLFDSLQIQDPL